MVAGRCALFCLRSQRLVESRTGSGKGEVSKRCARWTPSLACRNGDLACRVMHSNRLTGSSAPTLKKECRDLRLIDTRTKKLERIDCPYTDIRFLRASPGQAVMRAGSPTEAAAIVRFDFETKSFEVLRRSNDLGIDADYISVPRAVEFPTEDGLTAHAFFYPPKNPEFHASGG